MVIWKDEPIDLHATTDYSDIIRKKPCLQSFADTEILIDTSLMLVKAPRPSQGPTASA